MKITWLGQAGLLFETENTKIMIDPYLSSSCAKLDPSHYRKKPVDDRFLSVRPDILMFTHDHLDHYDPETASVYLGMKPEITVISPRSVFEKALDFRGGHNYVVFDPGTVWTAEDVRITGVKAYHSEKEAIGYLIEAKEDGKIYYVTGDTLYNDSILASLPAGIHAVFLPINGVGNNMNVKDAMRFARKCGAKYSVPLHFGLHDELDGHIFTAENRIIPEFYKEIPIPD